MSTQFADQPIDPKSRPILEIAVPVYNEALVLDTAIRRLHEYLSTRFPFSWRVVIVDNASTDETLVLAHRLARELPDVEVLHLAVKGRGLALRTAWSRSTALVVAYTDVDLSTDLDALLPLVAPIISGHSDLAVGSRLVSTASVARPPKREAISRIYNLLLRLAFSTRVHDAQCGFKALRADLVLPVLAAVVDDGWFFDTELLLIAERNGLRIHELPVDWVDDVNSSVDVWRTARGDLKGVLRLIRVFARGGGRIAVDHVGRMPFREDMGRRFITFVTVGVVSTALSLVLFLALRSDLGPPLAVVVALSATAVGNSWAHRRWTLGRRGSGGLVTHAVASGVIAVCGIGASVVALLLVDASGGGLLAELATLAVTWTLATMTRLLFLARSVT